MERITTPAALRALAATAPAQPDPDCSCRLSAFTGWDSITDERWPAVSMEQIADLRAPDVAAGEREPTFAEYHPQGTRYHSADAPIALDWFPTNRATAWRCTQCSLLVLRYTEYGGYYVDHRVRVLRAERVVDAPTAPAA